MEGDFSKIIIIAIALVILAAPAVIIYLRIKSHKKRISELKEKGARTNAKVTNFYGMGLSLWQGYNYVVYYEYHLGGIKYKGKANWSIPKSKSKFEGKVPLVANDTIDIVYLSETPKTSFPVEQLKHEDIYFNKVDLSYIIMGFVPIIIIMYMSM